MINTTGSSPWQNNVPTTPADPDSWADRAACATIGGDLWFPEQGEGESAEVAKRICNGIPGRTEPCPVRAECLEAALVRKERYGIFGGLNERSRRSLLKRREAAA